MNIRKIGEMYLNIEHILFIEWDSNEKTFLYVYLTKPYFDEDNVQNTTKLVLAEDEANDLIRYLDGKQ